MAVMKDGDPIVIFAGYEKEMDKFLNVNPGLRSRIYRKFVFQDYSTNELQIFYLKARKKGFHSRKLIFERIFDEKSSHVQRRYMNA